MENRIKCRKSAKQGEVSKVSLLKAISDTYDDSWFWVGVGLDDDKSFFDGLYNYRSCRYSKKELIQLVTSSPYSKFPRMPERKDYLVIAEKYYISVSNIDNMQKYPAVNMDGYTHIFSAYNGHYDVYYKIDRNETTITFALGTLKRTIPLECNTEWVWKLNSDALLCSDIDHLEKTLQDPFWCDRVIKMGRKALRIKSVL